MKQQALIYHSDPEMALEVVDEFRLGTDTGVADPGDEPLPRVRDAQEVHDMWL